MDVTYSARPLTTANDAFDMQYTRDLTRLGLAMLLAGWQLQASAADTVITFTGTCENAACTANGANGTVPGSVSATLTLSDLSWQPLATGGYEAAVSNAFNFGYNGPHSFVHVGNGDPLNGDQSYLYSSDASITGIYEFKIVWGQVPEGITAPGLGFLSGNASGWRWGGYTMLPVGPISLPFPYDWHRSSQAWQWSVSSVPEPATYGLFALGLGLVGAAARLRRSRPA